ncbi:chemotaxis protein CheW [Methylobacterium nigriterrae]|uniref:chemotaxis protein CheW n=1 Tax=Methylobacterium nigriterrae TaxID=3127512 RepID=UPI003013876F
MPVGGTKARADEAARTRGLREARTIALARRGRERASGSLRGDPAGSVLVCACGSERYGLPLAAVAQILPAKPCTSIPEAPPALLGIVALSGAIVSVLSLARALGREGVSRGEDGHLVVLRATAAPIALAVDRALGVARLAADGADSASADARILDGLGSEAVSGYAPAELGAAGVGDFVVVDLPRLLRRFLP